MRLKAVPLSSLSEDSEIIVGKIGSQRAPETEKMKMVGIRNIHDLAKRDRKMPTRERE